VAWSLRGRRGDVRIRAAPLPAARDTTDLLVTLEAEEVFDLSALPTITSPTLIVNGGRDQFYERAVIDETHRLIPGSRPVGLPTPRPHHCGL